MENNRPAPHVTSLISLLFIRFFLFIACIYLLKVGRYTPALFLVALLVIFEVASLVSRLGLKKLWLNVNVKPCKLFPGERGTIEITLENKKLLPVLLKWSQALPPILGESAGLAGKGEDDIKTLEGNIYIGSHGRERISESFTAIRRGCYTMPELRVQSRDVFGLFYRDSFKGADAVVMVYPRLALVDRLDIRPSDFSGLDRDERPYLFDPIMFVGLRDYTPDMPSKLIHWKASAHHDRVMAKIIESSSDMKILIVLDASALLQFSPELFEEGLSVAASLAVWADEAKIPFGFISDFSQKGKERAAIVPVNRADDQSRLVLECLARAEYKVLGSVDGLLEAESRHIPWGTTLILVGSRRSLLVPAAIRQVVYYPLDANAEKTCANNAKEVGMP